MNDTGDFGDDGDESVVDSIDVLDNEAPDDSGDQNPFDRAEDTASRHLDREDAQERAIERLDEAGAYRDAAIEKNNEEIESEGRRRFLGEIGLAAFIALSSCLGLGYTASRNVSSGQPGTGGSAGDSRPSGTLTADELYDFYHNEANSTERDLIIGKANNDEALLDGNVGNTELGYAEIEYNQDIKSFEVVYEIQSDDGSSETNPIEIPDHLALEMLEYGGELE